LTPLEIVEEFISALERKDIDSAISLLADDCEYDNVPMGKMFGSENVREFLGPMIENCSSVDWPVHRSSSSGNLVFNERLDRFEMGGNWIEIPVCGVWEVIDEKITLWRDYFDLATYRDQLPK
jgi:limonene-1,2-epoxide hydrolase|tara:strand:- start:2997 stop:3365 length:369 start_codon:yes stop_codon:yes gene_type:complete